MRVQLYYNHRLMLSWRGEDLNKNFWEMIQGSHILFNRIVVSGEVREW